MTPVDALLAGLIDYAGLFPPASQQMRDAVASYDEYLRSDDRPALGRFIVPVTRLGELESAATDLLPKGETSEPWRLSVLVGGDIVGAAQTISDFNRRHSQPHSGRAVIDVVELTAASASEINEGSAKLPAFLTAYFEIPIGAAVDALVDAVASARARAKIRTGGVTPEAFPPPDDVIRFMATCLRAGVPFKATAGLHHPLRGDFRLTYEPDSPVGTMYGYLNVFLAAGLLAAGETEDAAREALLETQPSAIRFEEHAIAWRGRRLSSEQIRTLREFAISFGSCSFREPIDELSNLTRQTSRISL